MASIKKITVNDYYHHSTDALKAFGYKKIGYSKKNGEDIFQNKRGTLFSFNYISYMNGYINYIKLQYFTGDFSDIYLQEN